MQYLDDTWIKFAIIGGLFVAFFIFAKLKD
jgi:hypothetical protein